jgi:hypothetical protein
MSIREEDCLRRILLYSLLLLALTGGLLQPRPSFAIDRVIYDDALAAGWENWSWTEAVDFANPAPVRSGSASIAVTFEAAYQGFSLRTAPPLSTAGYSALAFAIYGGAGDSQLSLSIQPADTGDPPTSYPLTAAAGTWSEVSVPLSALGSPAVIARITLQEASGAAQPTFYLDNLRLVGAAEPPPADSLTLSVNAAAARKPINADIYGLHEADEAFAAEIGLPVRRNGGNLTTRYNWKNNATNSGLDYYFVNRAADISADDFIARDRRTSTKSIITIPMTGWVAKDSDNASCGFSVTKYGYLPQQFGSLTPTNPYHPHCGTGVTGFSAGGSATFYKPVDRADTSVPFSPADAQAWVAQLVASYGLAGQGGVPLYSLDNEPDLWASTHADLVQTAPRYQEFRDTTYQYAAAIKQADASAQTLGPALGSYAYYFHSFYDGQREDWGTPDDRTANGGTPFLAWYLQQMQAYEAANGTRLLDYLDVHWYPQNGAYNNPAGSEALQIARLDSVRALWDPSYIDPAWQNSAPDGGIIKLIPRLHELVAANYPGTKIAISEYSWGAHADLSGALAQADILGIFGREGLDLATLFDGRYEGDASKFTPERPSAYAFRIYRNYDGAGSRFGETSVQASSSDQGKLAIYAAQRGSDGALTLVVINKTKAELSSALALSGFTPGPSAAVYRYSAANLGAIVRQADQALGAGGLSAAFPAESITLLVIPAAAEPPPAGPDYRVFAPLLRR